MHVSQHPWFFSLFLAIGTLLVASGCRRATEQDCQRIIDRIVELELEEQGITDPKLVEERKKATREQKQEELLSGCVGKRISESALTCIDNAKTSKEITEECLR